MLTKDKSKRLGFEGDVTEILAHPFFASLDLPSLELQQLEPPFKPEVKGGAKFDLNLFSDKSSAQDLTETYVPEAKVRKVEKFKDQFKDFDSKF